VVRSRLKLNVVLGSSAETKCLLMDGSEEVLGRGRVGSCSRWFEYARVCVFALRNSDGMARLKVTERCQRGRGKRKVRVGLGYTLPVMGSFQVIS